LADEVYSCTAPKNKKVTLSTAETVRKKLLVQIMLKAQEKFSIKCKGDDKPFQNSGVATANDQPHS